RSDDTSTPRTGRVVVEELRALLREKGLAPPYVLVGHSLGGLYMQLFARTHPDEVAGLVLVDTTPPSFSTSVHGVYGWLVVTFYMVGIRGREFAAISETGQDVLRAPPLMGKPVILLAATEGGAPRAQQAVAELYPGCRFVWVASGHAIQKEQPQAVLSAIRVILQELRAESLQP
ncbi:MAG TPA: alpha/beta hydrolase, partial [Polyangiaceae bacterium]